ncbi:MAG: hypothetical protein OXC44_06405 [Proteobacteria bacterium]|nr:hypothetical protein [Pseudomonadota bacterium]
MQPQHADLAVDRISSSLEGVRIDVCVTGSIAAVESFSLVRDLRRLGASVRVVLSHGAEMFITSTSLAWASACEVVTSFSALNSHLADGDLCVVAPASASFLSRLASGLADSPAAALCQSYLGSNLPVLVVPCMHDSLLASPFVSESMGRLSKKVMILESRCEDGKHKFPSSAQLSFEISHHYHRFLKVRRGALVVMGSSRGYMDDVRYMTSFSSGKMGCVISEELYRFGIQTTVVVGDSAFLPCCYHVLHSSVYAFEEMHSLCVSLLKKDDMHIILPASILDYVPDKRELGKLPSGQSSLNVALCPTPKLRSLLKKKKPLEQKKICFKLESKKTQQDPFSKYSYMSSDEVDLLVVNYLKDMETSYRGYAYDLASSQKKSDKDLTIQLSSKQAVAEYICRYLMHSAM